MNDQLTLLETVDIPPIVLLLPNCLDNFYRRVIEYDKNKIEAGLKEYQKHLNKAKCNLRLLFCLKSTKVVIEDIENVIINFMRLNAYPPKVIEPKKPLNRDDLYD